MKSLDLVRELFIPFDDDQKKTITGGGGNSGATYVDWPKYVLRAHATFPQGYSKSVTVSTVDGWNEEKDGSMTAVSTLVVTVRITDNATGHYQEALGAADAGKSSWGGAIAEAESQAFRRSMANWGLGLEMYLKTDAEYDWAVSVLGGTIPDDSGEEETEGAEPTPRQLEVLETIGKFLSNEDVEDFLQEQREVLDHTFTKDAAGAVIRRMRDKLTELGLEDPTKADES